MPKKPGRRVSKFGKSFSAKKSAQWRKDQNQDDLHNTDAERQRNKRYVDCFFT